SGPGTGPTAPAAVDRAPAAHPPAAAGAAVPGDASAPAPATPAGSDRPAPPAPGTPAPSGTGTGSSGSPLRTSGGGDVLAVLTAAVLVLGASRLVAAARGRVELPLRLREVPVFPA
ncbi:hypothetical protein HGA09_16935, partial [Cellulomonas hominis]|nr:hypothetical protein [Cellulomonas hominis]